MTPKEKLDKALGISDGKSVKDFLSDLDIENNDHVELMSQVDSSIKETIGNLDKSLIDLRTTNNTLNSSITEDIQKSLSDVNELVNLSKQIIQHLYTDIVSSELIDSELIASTASFIQATHDNIKEYIELYRDRLKFFDSVKLEMIKHQNRTEELKLKHELDMEKFRSHQAINGTPENMRVFSQEDIVGALKNMEL